MRAYEDFEIVYVGQNACLYDSESRRREYSRPDGEVLERGYYVVSWPRGEASRAYDERAVFRGPFKRYQDAVTNLRHFLVLAMGRHPQTLQKPLATSETPPQNPRQWA